MPKKVGEAISEVHLPIREVQSPSISKSVNKPGDLRQAVAARAFLRPSISFYTSDQGLVHLGKMKHLKSLNIHVPFETLRIGRRPLQPVNLPQLTDAGLASLGSLGALDLTVRTKV